MSTDLFKKATCPKELRIVRGMGHTNYNYEDHIFCPIEEFMANHLKFIDHVLELHAL